MENARSYSVPAVERAVDVLEWLAADPAPRSISEIGRRLKIPKSSAFAILQTLLKRGYIEKSSDDRYTVSLKLFTVASTMIASLDIRQQVGPILRELAAQTNLTAHLAVREFDEAVYIDKAEVPGAIRLTTYAGCRAALHSTAIGKALLAWLPESEIDRIVQTSGLHAYTPRTITDPASLRADLKLARNNGYAAAMEENEPGVCGVAAPVFDHDKRVTAAVNLGGTTLQIKRKDTRMLGTAVARAAAEMSRRLGYRG